MILGPVFQIVAFGLFAGIAIAGALGMTTTMSMFRSGVFLMGSFIGVAGLFIMLSADLLGLLQIMMYIGGMLVMILFMVLFMHDPGGAMMTSMDMAPIEKFFSLGIPPEAIDHGGMQHGEGEMDHSGMQHGEGEMGGMDMDMAMTTPIKRPAVVLAVIIGVLLVALLLLRPAWPISAAVPNPNSAEQIGRLLMGKYMIAFEGAGLLILIGIFGAVFLARPGAFPDRSDRETHVAHDDTPAAAGDTPLEPLLPAMQPDGDELVGVVGAHRSAAE